MSTLENSNPLETWNCNVNVNMEILLLTDYDEQRINISLRFLEFLIKACFQSTITRNGVLRMFKPSTTQ